MHRKLPIAPLARHVPLPHHTPSIRTAAVRVSRMLGVATPIVKTTICLITLLCSMAPSFGTNRHPEGSGSPNGKREILVSGVRAKGGYADSVIVRQIAHARVIDVISFHAPSEQYRSVDAVYWNSRSDHFVLEGSSFPDESFIAMYAITDRGVVERPFPSLDDIKIDPTGKLEKFHQEHGAGLGEAMGRPGGGWSFVRWVDARSFELQAYFGQQFGSRRVGYNYVITLRVSARDGSMKSVKIQETIGYLDKEPTK